MSYIPYGGFAQNRFRFRSQHLGTESGDNSRRPRLEQKPRVKPVVVWLLVTLQKKHFFILNDNKEIEYRIRPFSKIHQNIVLPVQNLGGGGAFAPLPDASNGPARVSKRDFSDSIFFFKSKVGLASTDLRKFLCTFKPRYRTRNYDPNNYNLTYVHNQDYYRHSNLLGLPNYGTHYHRKSSRLLHVTCLKQPFQYLCF